MSILKMEPAYQAYLWGGRKLIEQYGKPFEGEILAESWELSCHPDGPSCIGNGPFQGMTLEGYVKEKGKGVLGTHCSRFGQFPILIKLIDARENLSIQVHPDNAYALRHEGQYGKTEMWYVLEADEGASLYFGFKRDLTEEEFKNRIQDNTLLEVLQEIPVKKGDVFFIEAGTIHAIGAGTLIAEIQQNSNVTYRVFDYGRVGKDGKTRPLHVEKALAVTKRSPAKPQAHVYPHVTLCPYFVVDHLALDGHTQRAMEGVVTEASFLSILILDGEGCLRCDAESLPYKKGDSFFLPAGSGTYRIEGACDALLTTVPKQ